MKNKTLLLLLVIPAFAHAKKETRSVTLKTNTEHKNNTTTVTTTAFAHDREIGTVVAWVEPGVCNCPKAKKTVWNRAKTYVAKKISRQPICDCTCGVNCACIKPKSVVKCQTIAPVLKTTSLEAEMLKATKKELVSLGCSEQNIKVQRTA